MQTSGMGRWAIAVLAPLFAVALLLLLPVAQAEEQASGEVEEIVVTGSYIKGTPEDAPLPVTTLTRDELANEGAPTLLDLIKTLSFSQGPTARPTSSRPVPARTARRSTSAASGRAVRWFSSTAAGPPGRPTPSGPRRNCWWT